ncbi:hypothetical protein BDF22DRAFT_698343 [Syncephalis plumigaleata]|nr:hypothetical protein BDF22DRAFT_698343 [Syncephalis plumigaleata]
MVMVRCVPSLHYLIFFYLLLHLLYRHLLHKLIPYDTYSEETFAERIFRRINGATAVTGPPTVVAQLTRLETLDISGNRLTSVTSFPFEDLVQLRVLKLARNRLRTLPARIDVSENEIDSLPPNLADALALEEVRCVNNQLKEVPTSWKLLRLDNNQLIKFPGEILRDTPVVVVSITDNPLREEDFHRLEGYEEYSERRKDRCNQFLRG